LEKEIIWFKLEFGKHISKKIKPHEEPTGAEKNTWANEADEMKVHDAKTQASPPFLPSVSFFSPFLLLPSPVSARATHISVTANTRARGQRSPSPEQDQTAPRPSTSHRLASARLAQLFFSSSPLLSLSLSPLQIAIPQSKHFPFSSPPRSSPPPLQHATVVAAAAAAGKSPRALAAFRSGVAPPLSRRRVAPPAPSLWAVAWVCLGC
jgi:hypothetical protein